MPENQALYRWPAAAHVGRTVPKNAIYSHSSASAAVRQMFVDDVDRITWAFKLAESTIRLPASPDLAEVQVFVIDARGDDVPDQALATIDTAIPQPIIFEINRGADTRMVATTKSLGSGAPKVGRYYSTGWVPANTERTPLPTAITLDAMCTAILERLLPVAARPGESLSQVTDRLDDARRLRREVAALERKVRTERQFNRKVELRRELLAKQHELDTTK